MKILVRIQMFNHIKQLPEHFFLLEKVESFSENEKTIDNQALLDDVELLSSQLRNTL